MTVLTAADKIYLGTQIVNAVYAGPTKAWPVAAPPSGSYFTGGVESTVGGYKYHTFNSSGNLTLVGAGPVAVEYLVVAGGGAGGTANNASRYSGGAGAGGALVASVSLSASQVVTIGAGGAGGTIGVTSQGSPGSASSLGAVSATGGGGGAAPTSAGGDGGSGGGAGTNTTLLPGTGITGQGFAGGAQSGQGSSHQPGGGGGAGAAGVAGVTNKAGDGGAGVQWPAGSGTYYAGGGGGGGNSVGSSAVGGLGGGGAGSTSTTTPATAGTPNTGGGSGGNIGTTLAAPAGGSGVVIVRYPTVAVPTPSYFTGGVVTDLDTYRYHTFNTSGTLTFVPGDGPVSVEHLVVAGGGGGDSMNVGVGGGGGGAGGMLTGSSSLSANQTVTIGAGGAGGYFSATQGSSSVLGAISTVGGGKAHGGAGGSGGGNRGDQNVVGTGTAGQGSNGGGSQFPVVDLHYMGGGGGGKTTVGRNGNGNGNGLSSGSGGGGDGAEWPTGSGVRYAGGGGGGCGSTSGYVPGKGGLGGGGDGAGGTGAAAQGKPGSPNTGGGGGGGCGSANAQGAGGSGKVIVRYLKKAGMPDIPEPDDIPNLFGWWDATRDGDFTYSNGQNPANPPNLYVKQWNDRSGNNNHAVGNVDPTYHPRRLGTLNGLKVVDFNKVGAYMAAYPKGLPIPSWSPLNSKPSTYALVVRLPTPLTNAGQLISGYQGVSIDMTSSGVLRLGIESVGWVTQTPAGTVVAGGVYLIVAGWDTGGASFLRLNGTQQAATASSALATVDSTNRMSLGARDGTSFPSDSVIAEAIVYTRVLTTFEREQIEYYLRTKWGTP